MLSYNSFLLYHRNLFSNNKGDLNFYCLDFCLKYLHFLILYSVSVSRNSNLTNNFIWNPSFYFNFNWLLSFYYPLHYPLNFYNFNNLLYFYNNLFNRYLDDFLHFLNNNKRHWNLDNLQDRLLNYNDFLNYLWYFDYLLYNSWNNHNLFYNLLDFNNSWYFYNFLNNSISINNFDLYNFFFDYYWNRFLNLNSLYYLLSNWNQSHFLNFKLGDFFREIGNRNFSNNRNLFSYIHGNCFFNFYIFCCQYFFDYWLINKDFDLFDYLNLITFDEMRSLNEYFFGNFTNDFSFLNYRNLFYYFFVFVSIDKSISIFYEIDYLNLISFDLYWDLLFNIDYFFLFDYVVYITLNFFVLGLLNYNWDSHLDLFNLFNCFVNIVRHLNYSLYFDILLFFRFN